MKKTLLTGAALAFGLTLSSAPAMADGADYDECKVPNGVVVQLGKGELEKALLILISANTNAGAEGEIIAIKTFQPFHRRHWGPIKLADCSLIHLWEVPDQDYTLGDGFDQLGPICHKVISKKRPRRLYGKVCHYYASDPGNSADTES